MLLALVLNLGGLFLWCFSRLYVITDIVCIIVMVTISFSHRFWDTLVMGFFKLRKGVGYFILLTSGSFTTFFPWLSRIFLLLFNFKTKIIIKSLFIQCVYQIK